jgi:hypothetical protein
MSELATLIPQEEVQISGPQSLMSLSMKFSLGQFHNSEASLNDGASLKGIVIKMPASEIMQLCCSSVSIFCRLTKGLNQEDRKIRKVGVHTC